ncbi:hypothetical protein Osc2_07960 [Ruminococcus sp. 25CYCFAH16]
MNDEFFQALSNPYRREIIKLLRWENMSVGDIVKRFDIAQPTISRHLDVLRKAEIVTSERKGNQIIYSLNLSAMQEMFVYLSELFDYQKIKEVQSNECK